MQLVDPSNALPIQELYGVFDFPGRPQNEFGFLGDVASVKMSVDLPRRIQQMAHVYENDTLSSVQPIPGNGKQLKLEMRVPIAPFERVQATFQMWVTSAQDSSKYYVLSSWQREQQWRHLFRVSIWVRPLATQQQTRSSMVGSFSAT